MKKNKSTNYVLLTYILIVTVSRIKMLLLIRINEEVNIMTNFYPVHVYISNFRMYATLEKANFKKLPSRDVQATFAVLNLRELNSMNIDRCIYDLNINTFDTMKEAEADSKRQMQIA